MSDAIAVDYDGLIPNNVGLNADPRLRRALESWHPGCIDWWKERGPEGFQSSLVYLRTAVSVEPEGWARFGYVKMPDYRWGILLAPAVEGRTIGFGAHQGEPAWQEVPGEYRAMLRRLIVVQGDTEPASVEQQRISARTAPSLYDLRNLFQVNVEEARHLWAMVYLLQKYFGRDGREEAEDLLRRRSGDRDSPRLLGAFNEATPDWLAFFMFTFFTDRDGKMQLHALAQSGFDPLSRTCRFMLTEEAHHMFVGQSGVGRIIERTCAAMREAGIDDPTDIERVRALGVIDLPTIQKRINLHFSLTLDLFGNEVSTNAANAFNAGLEGPLSRRPDRRRPPAGRRAPTRCCGCRDGRIVERGAAGLVGAQHAAARRLRRRRRIRRSSAGGTASSQRAGFDYRLHAAACRVQPPDRRVRRDRRRPRRQHLCAPRNGSAAATNSCRRAADDAFVASLMRPVTEPGAFASWIAPPRAGIDSKPGDFEYVKLAG